GGQPRAGQAARVQGPQDRAADPAGGRRPGNQMTGPSSTQPTGKPGQDAGPGGPQAGAAGSMPPPGAGAGGQAQPFRCGFVAVVGRPNVGKSTLTNALIGTKLSIVSRKAQTTRHRIHGVLTRDAEQFVFVDTPGFQTRHGGAMNRMMNRVVTQALADVDVGVHVVEGGKWSAGDAQLLPS